MKALISICIVLLFSSCGANKKDNDQSTLNVATVPAKELATEGNHKYTFISKPYKTSLLSFRVGGPVVQFDVQPGQFYRKGAVIAAIDNRDFKIRKEQTKAVYTQAEKEYNRISNLYKKGNVSGSKNEKAEADYVTAKTAYEIATNELNDTYLIAPFDGYIQTVDIQKHEDVRPSQTVVSFIDISKVKAETYITEKLAIELRKSANQAEAEAQLLFDQLPNQIFRTRDITVSQSTTNNNLSYLLTAVIDNKDYSLLGGMAGSLFLPFCANNSKTSVFIPLQAVCNQPQRGTYVWILKGDVVQSIPVKLGQAQQGKLIEVESGIQANDQVIISNTTLLYDNRKVGVLQ